MELEEIIRRTTEIDARIGQLLEERETILRQDPKYAEYLNAFEERGYYHKPLSISMYHILSIELLAISKGFPGPMTEEYLAYWQKYRRRIVELERILLA
jgi:hypothetical protein